MRIGVERSHIIWWKHKNYDLAVRNIFVKRKRVETLVSRDFSSEKEEKRIFCVRYVRLRTENRK